MKITKLLLLVVAALAFACSSDDDEPSLEKRTLSISGNEQVIAVPAAMQNVENYAAQAVVGMIDDANFMSTYLSMMQVPAGGTKGSERITAANGRVNAAGDFVVYTYADEQGNQIAYQISETSDSYVFEIFLLIPDLGEGWTKLFQAQEKKDRSSGSLIVYDIYGSDDLSAILFSYTWGRSGDNFTLTVSVPSEETSAVLVINEKTKAGSATSTVGGVKQYEITWDAAGNGTYVYYDSEGQISDEGTWTA